MHEVLSVPDMSCGHCKSAVEGALQPLVESVDVDLDKKTVAVSYDESGVSRDKIVSALDEAGYPVGA